MSYNPLQDAKFLTALMDTVISLVLFFGQKYAPMAADDIKFAIGAIQPIFLLLIVGFFQRDQAALRAGKALRFLK